MGNKTRICSKKSSTKARMRSLRLRIKSSKETNIVKKLVDYCCAGVFPSTSQTHDCAESSSNIAPTSKSFLVSGASPNASQPRGEEYFERVRSKDIHLNENGVYSNFIADSDSESEDKCSCVSMFSSNNNAEVIHHVPSPSDDNLSMTEEFDDNFHPGDSLTMDNSIDQSGMQANFVEEDELGSESEYSDLETEFDQPKEDQFSLSGRRIIDIAYFLSSLKRIRHHGFGCSFFDVEVISEKRTGIVSCFTTKCNMCKKLDTIYTDDPNSASIDATTGAVLGKSQE